jgi:hypothetical protein
MTRRSELELSHYFQSCFICGTFVLPQKHAPLEKLYGLKQNQEVVPDVVFQVK